MKIGIIGTGRMGSGLAKRFSAAGHHVMLGSRTLEKARDVANTISPQVQAGSYADTVQFGEVLVLTTPFGVSQGVLESLGDLGGKVLIEITNDLAGNATQEANTSQLIAEWAQNAHVVKAFNTVFFDILHAELPAGASRGAVFLAGENTAAKATVASLASDIGFQPVDVGGLDKADYLDTMVRVIIEIGRGRGRTTAFQIIDVAKP